MYSIYYCHTCDTHQLQNQTLHAQTFEKQGVKRIFEEMPDICIDVPAGYTVLEKMGDKMFQMAVLPENLYKDLPARYNFLAHLVYQPKNLLQSCFVHRASLGSAFVSVHTPPSHRIKHTNFIFGTDMYPYLVYPHQIFSHSDLWLLNNTHFL